jgi:CxxC motif-containing protein (DUF1111 family)
MRQSASKFTSATTLVLLTLGMVIGANSGFAQTAVDPGPRGAPAGAGAPIANLSTEQTTFFLNAKSRFVSPEGVANGLGPTFNGNSCGMCHSQPAIGGTSPNAKVYPFVGPNPQVALANLSGATNKVPDFITADGPVREARFKYVLGTGGRGKPGGEGRKGMAGDRGILNEEENGSGQPVVDGGVHDLFTIQDRSDAKGCTMAQDNFKEAAAEGVLIFRIPTPVFGGGLIEMITDATILANQKADALDKAAFGIGGITNRSGNDGTITRFGWKAQNKSLLQFSHEAYSVELGETNQMFPDKRGFGGNPPPEGCIFNPLPEDFTNFLPEGSLTELVPSDDDSFATFMRFLDQPIPSCKLTVPNSCSPSIQNGAALFNSAKCALCHTPSMTTGNSSFTVNLPGLTNVAANLFSDLLLHHMGDGLADGISQGNAGPDQFRTAPLWGIGQRIFFLHDGRTSDLLAAIKAHASRGSEANGVIQNFNRLTESQKQDLLNFLRSL